MTAGAPVMGGPGLSITEVTKNLGGRPVVSDLTLEVNRGELVCLLGPSGCGKTTTLRMVGGFLPPDAGRIYIDGVDVTDMAPERRPTAMVFQNYALWPHMTVFKNIAFGLRLRKLPKDEIADRVGSALDLVNLGHARDRHPSALSGGEQQRVALARAIVLEPKLLLLDEPLSNLDAKLRAGVREEIREIQQRLQITTLFVTHDQDEALSVADRVAVMSEGRVEQYSGPGELYGRPETWFVAGFVGAMNFYTARLCGDGLDLGPGQAYMPCGPAAFSGLEGTDESWEIAVRLEDVRVTPAGAGPGRHPLGQIVKQVPHGHFKEVVVQLQGSDLRARAYVAPSFQPSGPLRVSFDRVMLYRGGRLAHEYSVLAEGGGPGWDRGVPDLAAGPTP
jgi:putative spermidine/putrescine transport system ATP-binding protein